MEVGDETRPEQADPESHGGPDGPGIPDFNGDGPARLITERSGRPGAAGYSRNFPIETIRSCTLAIELA